VLWTNCEAATEIARQLRLRNIAGVIIVDFIDMESRKDQLMVIEHFNKALKMDKARPQIAQLSELGLVELTRKRQGQNIYELFGQTCPTCGGLGHLVHLPGEPNRTGEEVAEPLVTPPPVREVRAFRETPPPEPAWEARSEAVEDTQPDDQLAIMYHPDYQERTGPNTSRRRRRRRFGEPPVREEPTKSPVRISAPLPIVNHFRSSSVAEPEGLSLEERATRTEDMGIPPASSFRLPSADETGTGLSAGEERLRGPKPERPKPAKEIEPPEIVSVEMTPEEQDVYALMGISPLVLINRPVKNSKSVIVSVTSPGEPPETHIAEEFIRERNRGEEFVQQHLEFEPQILETNASPIELSVVEQPASYYEPEEQEYEPQIEQLTPEPVAVTVESEPESSPSDVRRRRRRSSATNASEG
jgi:ribonuclease E